MKYLMRHPFDAGKTVVYTECLPMVEAEGGFYTAAAGDHGTGEWWELSGKGCNPRILNNAEFTAYVKTVTDA